MPVTTSASPMVFVAPDSFTLLIENARARAGRRVPHSVAAVRADGTEWLGIETTRWWQPSRQGRHLRAPHPRPARSLRRGHVDPETAALMTSPPLPARGAQSLTRPLAFTMTLCLVTRLAFCCSSVPGTLGREARAMRDDS